MNFEELKLESLKKKTRKFSCKAMTNTIKQNVSLSIGGYSLGMYGSMIRGR